MISAYDARFARAFSFQRSLRAFPKRFAIASRARAAKNARLGKKLQTKGVRLRHRAATDLRT